MGDAAETLEQVQARHRKEQRELQGRITNKKKNATKKTRKHIHDECAELERQLRERQEEELRRLVGGGPDGAADDGEDAGETSADVVADQLAATTLETRGDAAAASAGSPDEPRKEEEGGGGGGGEKGQQQQQQQQQQPQPPKKRNRQKERLARRAAEQEAMAAAAAAEAAGMADRRGDERARMRDAFRARGLEEHEVRPDGHCLFSAVADQLAQQGIPLAAEGDGQGEPPYKAVRRAATAYMEARADEFAGFVEEPFHSYVAKMRDTAEWGGQLELTALAGAYGVEIHVVQDGRTEVFVPREAAGEADGGEARKTLWLAYYRHDYGLGEHYNSLRKAAAAAK